MPSSKRPGKKKEATPTKRKRASVPDNLLQKAFENSMQANIISIGASGRIIRANRAACKLLGHSKKELLTRKRKDIFRISDENYGLMLIRRAAEGGAKADLSL